MKVELGKKYNLLTPVELIGSDQRRRRLYRCICDCGNERIAVSSYLLNGTTKSCGCTLRQATIKRSTTHGKTKHPLYHVWMGMKTRCFNEKCGWYHRYGGRGITVCDDWKKDFQIFYEWAMASGYREGLSLDRIDVNGNYEPNNCRWATIHEQQNNRRNNVHIEAYGRTLTVAEWAIELGISKETIYTRLKHGDIGEHALRPARRKR